MNLEQFIAACDLHSLREVDRACHLAFFYLRKGLTAEFSASDAAIWLSSSGATPNASRLEKNLRESHNTVRAPRGFKLTPQYVKALDEKFPNVAEKSQEIVQHDTILPQALYLKTRPYIVNLAKQVNVCYEQNAGDACAVMMRRLAEVLLILAYRHLQIEDAIKDNDGNFFMLEGIVKDAKTNPKLDLSRNSKKFLDEVRTLGNFAAHKIEYTCYPSYIKPLIQEYRGLIEELIHKADLLK